jgi:hypothetical protein
LQINLGFDPIRICRGDLGRIALSLYAKKNTAY